MDSKIDLHSLLDLDIRKAIIHEVPGITRCFLSTQKDGAVHLKTEGLNILVAIFVVEFMKYIHSWFYKFYLWIPERRGPFTVMLIF